MIAALASSLAQRSARERGLVAVLLLLVLPFAAAFLIGGPLMDRREAARAERAEAEVTRAWYRVRQFEVAALPRGEAGERERAAAPVGLGGIEERLIGAGLRDAVSQLANAQGNRVALTFEGVAFEALMPWLEGIERDAGYRVAALTVTRTDDPGAVDADLQLEPRP
jgi:type II secretory pathway component PulM